MMADFSFRVNLHSIGVLDGRYMVPLTGLILLWICIIEKIFIFLCKVYIPNKSDITEL